MNQPGGSDGAGVLLGTGVLVGVGVSVKGMIT